MVDRLAQDAAVNAIAAGSLHSTISAINRRMPPSPFVSTPQAHDITDGRGLPPRSPGLWRLRRHVRPCGRQGPRHTPGRYAPLEARRNRRGALQHKPMCTLINHSRRTDRETGGHDDTSGRTVAATTLPQCPNTIRRGPNALPSTCERGLPRRRPMMKRSALSSAGTLRLRPAGGAVAPTIRCVVLAGVPWLDVYCPGCGTSRAIDIRTLDRHPLASVGGLVLGLRCMWCHGATLMPVLTRLHQARPAHGQKILGMAKMVHCRCGFARDLMKRPSYSTSRSTMAS